MSYFVRGVRAVGRATWFGLGVMGDDRVVLMFAGCALGLAGKNLSMGVVPEALGLTAIGGLSMLVGLMGINQRLRGAA